MSYIFLDCETGGLDPAQHSLLTISMHLVENIYQDPVSIYNAKLLYPVYHCSPRALEINGINLAEFARDAKPVDEVRQEIADWLRAFTRPYYLVGWNVGFDLGFVYKHLFTKEELGVYGVNYHSLDVCALVEFLIIKKVLPPARRLVEVASSFGIDTSGAHDASFDNTLCRLVLQKLLAL